MLKKIGKGIKKFVEDKVQVCKSILLDPQIRFVIGCILVGTGGGLIISACVRVN